MGNTCCSSSGVAGEGDAEATPFPKRASTAKAAAKARPASVKVPLAEGPPLVSSTKALADGVTPLDTAIDGTAPLPPAMSTAPVLALGRPPIGVSGAEESPAATSAAAAVAANSATETNGRLRRRRRVPSPRLGSMGNEELVTDTFQISPTTVSDGDDEDDTFSVDVSMPTHSTLFLDRPAHLRTFSDATSEVDFTATSFDRPRADRSGLSRGLAARDLVAMEAERRARIVRAAQTARRGLWKSLCREQAAHERATMLQRFFVERLALMLWAVVAREAVARTQLGRAEASAFEVLRQQQDEALRGRPLEDCATGASPSILKGSSQSSQHAWDSSLMGTRANGATTDVDLTSTSSFDEEEITSVLHPAAAAASPPSSLRIAASSLPASTRPSTAPATAFRSRGRAAAAAASDDLFTAGSTSLERTIRSTHRGLSPVATAPRRIVYEKHVAKIEGNTASSHGQR